MPSYVTTAILCCHHRITGTRGKNNNLADCGDLRTPCSEQGVLLCGLREANGYGSRSPRLCQKKGFATAASPRQRSASYLNKRKRQAQGGIMQSPFAWGHGAIRQDDRGRNDALPPG